MGGFGSGKGLRTQINRRRKRLYTTEVPSVSYKWINVEGIDMNRPIGRFYLKDKVLAFKMRTHILYGGGIWYSFACRCGRAPRTLYLRNQRFACRNCHELAYLSENKGKTARSIDQKWKYQHQLGDDIDLPVRPKWMKRQAYDRICQKIEKYHQLPLLDISIISSNGEWHHILVIPEFIVNIMCNRRITKKNKKRFMAYHISKTIKVIILLHLLFLYGCQNSKEENEFRFSIEGLLTGIERTAATPYGSVIFYTPSQWQVDRSRLIEVQVFQDSTVGKEIEIGKVMNVFMDTDPEDFTVFSKPHETSAAIPVQGHASWSWCLKPKKTGVFYLCFEIDIEGKEFGKKSIAQSIPVHIHPLPFWQGGLSFWWKKNWQWIIPLGSLLVAILAEIKGLLPTWGHRKINKKLDRIDSKLDIISKQNKE